MLVDDKLLPKLIVTDLDGTIVSDDRLITDRTVAAFELARSKGARILFATGRPASDLADVSHRFPSDLVGHTVCCNGAMLYDMGAKSYLPAHDRAISQEDAVNILSIITDLMPTAALGIQLRDEFVLHTSFKTKFIHGTPPVITQDIVKACTGSVYKLCIQANKDQFNTTEDLMAALPESVSSLVEITHAHSKHQLLEFAAKGVSKGSTVKQLAASWGIAPSQIMAFGDGSNDITMLEMAHHSYAMDDGKASAVAAARNTALSLQHDGVAKVIESFFL